MESIYEHIGEVITGSWLFFLGLIITGWRSLMSRIKKLEENQIRLEKDLEINSKLDEARAEK